MIRGSLIVRALAFGALVLLSLRAAGHQDTTFRLLPDGLVEGVPEPYGPIHLWIDHHRPFPWLHRKISVRLQVRGTSRTLPGCIARLFDIPTALPIRLSGSWYHDLDSIPPYLYVELPQKLMPDYSIFGHSITFDLRTAAVLSVWEQKPVDGVGQVDSPVDLNSLCTPDEVVGAVRSLS